MKRGKKKKNFGFENKVRWPTLMLLEWNLRLRWNSFAFFIIS